MSISMVQKDNIPVSMTGLCEPDARQVELINALIVHNVYYSNSAATILGKYLA